MACIVEGRVMDKQKILIVHNYYQIPGGEDIVVANEKQMLEKHGHEVFLYSRNNSEIKKMSIVHRMLLPFIYIFNVKTYLDIKRIIIEKNINIIHVHNTLSLVSPSVYYIAVKYRVPIVQTVHNFRLICPGATFYRDGHVCEDCVKGGLVYAVRYGCYRNNRLQTLICVLNIKIHRLAGIYKKINYICLTEFNKNKLLLYDKIKPEQIFVKPNFVMDCGSSVMCEQRKNYIVFAGRLDKSKGTDILLEAWKLMKNRCPKLIICGEGPLEKWCYEFIAENQIKAEMLGFIENDEVRKLIAGAKALVLPTQWYEGFPMSIIEAFSVGTPVICSDIGNVGSIVKEGITGCKFEPRSARKLAQAVYRLEDYKSIYETTIKEYYENYTQDCNYKYLIKIYRKILL